MSSLFPLSPSPVEEFNFAGHRLLVKRDDLLHPQFSGNKARKFAWFLEHDFPGIKRLIGHGSAQANSLYSMAALARLKGWHLQFYVDHISEHLRLNPCGNFKAALALGAELIEVGAQARREGMNLESYLQQHLVPTLGQDCLFVPEGGRCGYAEYGVAALAQEIAEYASTNKLTELKLMLPSGTGTTALFLNKYFVEQGLDIQVLTCALVGDDNYLKAQFAGLGAQERHFPTILSPGRKYHFGKCYREFFEIWLALEKTGTQFELLYDPLAWILLLDYMDAHPDARVLYLHQGGLLGNESMLPRYVRKFPELAHAAGLSLER
ncbi:1-aminocyclopropane-1-carboxylate deaminase/D-cysteine desulfhydrase [Shewanella cyperi]|uniref:1-aminocyclopropane-1-carboxylate deaminase/D-cysteine desulfhydrase n=1 Tax=Shewanella cyperi TaxID=2814292 RepID=UPI001D18F1D0|nr:1-aminocyclopropane-1-carboxylate deaminase/D-cysteine desulfhydrase [Shewanella cyperi]